MSAKLHSVVLASLLLAAVACGSKPKEAVQPSTDTASASDSGTDMPATPSTDSDAGATTPTDTANTPPPAPAGLTMPTGTVKIDLTAKKAKLEIKSDGSVSNGGKAAAKLTGTEVQDATGKTLATVSGDAIKTAGGSDWASFSGDDLVLAKGDKLSIGDDGTITWTTGGKGKPAGKADGVGPAKKATLIAAAWVIAPPAAEKPATTTAKPPGTGKPTGKPPAGKK